MQIGGAAGDAAPKRATRVFRMHHEVRSLLHPMFMRPLVNTSGTTGLFAMQ
jgi:hypothetical protein